jgi:fatty acid desaturase
MKRPRKEPQSETKKVITCVAFDNHQHTHTHTQSAHDKSPLDQKAHKAILAHVSQPKYLSSVRQSISHGLITLLLFAGWYGLAHTVLGWHITGMAGLGVDAALVFIYSLFGVRSFIIMHDCGHGSFFLGFPGAESCNHAMGFVMSCFCSTPTDWSQGHQLHHVNIGNIDQDDYDWFVLIKLLIYLSFNLFYSLL